MIWKSVAVLMAGLVLISCSGGGVPADDPTTVHTVFVVDGMHCDGCSSAITEALEGVAGVESAAADHEAGIAAAVYRTGNVAPEGLKVEIEKLGYTVSAWNTEPVIEPETAGSSG